MAAACALVLCLAFTPLPVLAQTPDEDLFKAVELNDMAAVDAAIKAGAQLSATNKNGMTAADLAVDLGHFRIAHALLAYRNGGSQVGPRVTDKGRQALNEPSNRIVPAPKPIVPRPAESSAAEPDPRIAEIVPPRKPVEIPALPATPEQPPKPATAPEPQKPAPMASAPIPAPSPDAGNAEVGTRTEEQLDRIYQAENDKGGGFLTSVMKGVHSIVTLGGLLGGDETPKESAETLRKRLPSPADRFSAPASEPSSESAAGRMVDRMMGTVGGDKQTENEFGLPTTPVLPPLPAPGASISADAPGMGTPLVSGGTTPSLPATPPETAPGVDMPGLAAPIESAERPGTPELPALGAPEISPPADGGTGIDIPGLAAPVEAPAASQAQRTPSAQPRRQPRAPATDIPGLPPGLEMPGLAPAAPTDEVPGIIPPPAASNEAIPALPPGLEPLPGSETGQLRRPGGLVQPEDPTALPAPGSEDLRARLRKLDDILRRGPGDVVDRYGTGAGGAPRIGAERPSAAPSIPVSRAPGGADGAPLTSAPADRRTDDIRDPEEILRKSREEARQRTILENRDRPLVRPTEPVPSAPGATGKPGAALDDSKIETPHALRPAPKAVTERAKPASRMIERLTGLGERQYPNDDLYGLPVTKPRSKDDPQPRRDVAVAELPDYKAKKVDDRIHKLARFFRGDQEQDAGMIPPEPEVQTAPLPQVVDNLIPENDPARGNVVDDRMLDLTGVEREPPAYRGQLGATRTGSGDENLNTNFLDKLNRALGPPREVRSVEQAMPPPPPGQTGLSDLDVPQEQMVPEAMPKLPDPWTMTIEKSEGDGQSRTLGVTAISPKDGSEIKSEQGVVNKMVGRIRELLSGPDGARGPDVAKLDEQERQNTAEQLLSEALRDGAPTALPDQNQWPVTEIDAGNAVPGVPPPPRPGVLSRTSLTDVVLSMGESVTLENTLPPQQDGVDPLNQCIKKNRGTTLFCIEPVDWPEQLRADFLVPTILYTGPMAITRYDQGTPSRLHALFDSAKFEDVVAYYQARYGEPTEIWKRSIAPLAKPREDNPTVAWRSRDSKTNIISVLEVRKYDDSRGGFPDMQRGAVMLYHLNAPQIFPQVSSHELMRLRRTR